VAQAANILKRLSSTATTGTETLSTMGSLRNALTAGSTDFSASGLVSLGSGQVPGFDQVAFYQHLVVSALCPAKCACFASAVAHTLRPTPAACSRVCCDLPLCVKMASAFLDGLIHARQPCLLAPVGEIR
jgi:hypothetical protein